MRRYARLTIGLTLAVGAATALVACGESGSSGTKAPASQAAAGGCAPVAGDSLVVLEDDKKLQNSDNVVPAVYAKAVTPELTAALDKVSSALDTGKLIGLNKAVDVERKTPKVAAEEFATKEKIADGLTKGAGGNIKVGAANFSESQTLGELYAVALRAAGYTVTVQSIGSREVYEPQLEKGEIQVVPEYAATLAVFLNAKATKDQPDAIASPEIAKTMEGLTALGQKAGIAFGKPSSAQDQNAFAVTRQFADKYGLKTLSDLASKCSGKATILAAGADCPGRDFCQKGLESKYTFIAGSFQALDPPGGAPTKTALKTGKASVGLVFSSDGDLSAS